MQMLFDGMFNDRTCVVCGMAKPPEEFGLTGGRSGSLRKTCMVCVKNRKLAIYHANKQSINAIRKIKYFANRMEYLRQSAISRRKNRAARAAYKLAYNRANPNKCRQWNHLRRARIAGAGGVVLEADIRRQFNRQCGRCYYCDAVLDKFELDHVMPISRGGGHYPENTVVACKPCNASKWNSYISEWRFRCQNLAAR